MSQQMKLDKDQLRALAQAEIDLANVLTTADKADQCGIDCQQLRQLVNEKLAEIEQLKTHFGLKSR